MKRFVLGLVLGLVVGSVGSAVAAGAGCFGRGTAYGWEVLINGRVVCEDPYISTIFKEIECD